ncbi:MAG: hypothetical protein HOI39_07460, partial [Flavobacteriales bacterium]|nr:hypothetical protein [Flavobacteriales bacterium]
NVYAIGFYEDAANFDGTVLNSLGRKDIFVWKMSMTPGSFTVNNTYDTVYTEVMEFNPADTGTFISKHIILDGCDTLFTDSVIHKRLGVQINYNINNAGTATFTINGVVQAMPYSQNYWAGENINIQAILQPSWFFNQWKTYNNNVTPNSNSIIASFVANSSDSCVLYTYPQPPISAFIFGNDSICVNASYDAEVSILFSGAVSPYTFVYAINGISQSFITTNLNPYIINAKQEGVYTLLSMSDSSGIGWVSGSALVTFLEAPEALFTTATDTLSILYPSVQLNDISEGNVVSWIWDFGDNSLQDFIANPYHVFEDSIGIYQINLIVTNEFGCSDTTFKQLWVADDYWMYIPNSFTPDSDGINDFFCIQYHGLRQETFHFNVYDRFSNLVYSTNDITSLECAFNLNGWDGKHYLSKKELSLGTYIYEMYFQDFEGWKHQKSGQIIIIK